MSKLTDSLATFATGDLVFTRYPPKGSQPIHVTLFLSPDAGYVHAGATHVEISGVETYVDDKDSGGYLHAHTADADRREKTKDVARIFAETVKRTPYGSFPSSKDFESMSVAVRSPRASRFNGMIGTQTVQEIPFEFPALHRLLKWTLRAIRKAPLSENRGITCAAFISACHQVTAMRAFLEETGAAYQETVIEECNQKLDSLVRTKADLRKELEVIARPVSGSPIYREQALAANSNRTLTVPGQAEIRTMGRKVKVAELSDHIAPRLTNAQNPLSQLDKTWLVIQTRLLNIHESQAKLVSEILPGEFMFDAKYVSSMALARCIRASAGWRSTIYDAY